MPFKAHEGFFKPDEFDILNDAYDAAWQRVCANSNGTDSVTSGRSQE